MQCHPCLWEQKLFHHVFSLPRTAHHPYIAQPCLCFQSSVAPLCSAAAPIIGLYFTSQSLYSPGYQWKLINTLFEAFFQIQNHSKLQHPSVLRSSTKIPWVFLFLSVLLSIHNNTEADDICSSTHSYPPNPKQRWDWSVVFSECPRAWGSFGKGSRVCLDQLLCYLWKRVIDSHFNSEIERLS